jgi:hypothetical protein
MNATKLVKQLLQLPAQWKIKKVNFKEKEQEVHIYIEYKRRKGVCKNIGEICPIIYDYRTQTSWRNLDMFGYHIYLYCCVPRVKNSLGKVVSIPLP